MQFIHGIDGLYSLVCFFSGWYWLQWLVPVVLCLLIGAFSPFTFKVNIVICEFDPVIMMLAGYFTHWLMQLIHGIDDFYNLVCICSG